MISVATQNKFTYLASLQIDNNDFHFNTVYKTYYEV